MSNNKFPLTQYQYDKLIKRIDELENVEIPANSIEIADAVSQGDLSENAEYDEAKDKQAKLHQELSLLKAKKSGAVIIKEPIHKDYVEIAHTVELELVDSKERKTLTLLGEWDRDLYTTSVFSPLGSLMLGKRPGEVFTVEAPRGETTYKVVRIL